MIGAGNGEDPELTRQSRLSKFEMLVAQAEGALDRQRLADAQQAATQARDTGVNNTRADALLARIKTALTAENFERLMTGAEQDSATTVSLRPNKRPLRLARLAWTTNAQRPG